MYEIRGQGAMSAPLMSGSLPFAGLRVLDLARFIAGPVATTVMGDEQAAANGAVVGNIVEEMPRTLSTPIRLSFAPTPVDAGPGPTPGQHTDKVLGELGYSAAEIRQLREARAVG